jgi:signal transduction histidine kinase
MTLAEIAEAREVPPSTSNVPGTPMRTTSAPLACWSDGAPVRASRTAAAGTVEVRCEARGIAVDESAPAGQQDDGDGFSTLLEEFEAVIAHELATPLAIINGAAALALDHDGDTPVEVHRAMLRTIRRNTELAELLLRRIGLARDIEAGTVELSRSQVDLGRLVDESVTDLREVVLGEHPVSVTIEPMPPILADATAAREIVFNLLSNAIKYSDDDAPIEVTAQLDGDKAEVIVRNHGTGVTPGETEKIFEKFHRGETYAPGAGLGLYISRGLARAHGGDITVQPAEDVGSEFRLTLPIGP